MFGKAIQATRPIIEYHPELQLNSSFDALRNPDDSTPGKYTQEKTRFNQIPQFDIYRYDGTHHGSTSGIFFYVEDPDFTTGIDLPKEETHSYYDAEYVAEFVEKEPNHKIDIEFPKTLSLLDSNGHRCYTAKNGD